MIYLLQDSYYDNTGYHDILKIGYSKNNFEKTRKNHYDTHNYGYIFLGEREGDIELESFLHKKYNSLRLSGEWFKWDQRIIDDFWNSRGDTVTKDEYLEKLREYTISKIVSISKKLSSTHLSNLLGELEITYNSNQEYQDVEFNKFDLGICIKRIWSDTCRVMKDRVENFDLSKLPISEDFPKIFNVVDLENDFTIFYKNFKNEYSGESEFNKYINSKINETNALIRAYGTTDLDGKRALSKQQKYFSKMRKYSDNYVSVSKTGDFILNKLIYLGERRAFEIISQAF